MKLRLKLEGSNYGVLTEEGLRIVVKRAVEDHAKEKGWDLNPKTLDTMVKGLVRNFVKYGKFYCPCKRVVGDPAIDDTNECSCDECEADVQEKGWCHCMLYGRPGAFAGMQHG